MRVALVLLAAVVVLSVGCFAPDVDVDSRGLRPAVAQVSTHRSSTPSSSESPSALTSRVEELEEDVAKLDGKLEDLKKDLKEIDDRLEKVEKKLD